MTLNIYRLEPGKPMIYSLESARSFIEQTKEEFQMYLGEREYLIVHRGCVKIVSRSYAGDIGIDFVKYQGTEENAVRMLYKLRKSINSHFKGE